MYKAKGRLLGGAALALSLMVGSFIAAAPASATAPVSAPTSKSCDTGNVKKFIKCLSKPKPVKKAKASTAAPESNVTQSNYSYTVEEYLDYIVADVDTTWSKWFKATGFEEPYTGIIKIEPEDPAFMSLCNLTVNSDTPNAFYCDRDSVTDANGVVYQGALILPVVAFQKMWTGDVLDRQSSITGDFAAAYIVAHEYGHSVQDEINIQSKAQGYALPAFTGANKELIADCFAGVWMTSAYYSKLMEEGDIEEAIAAAEAIADPVGVVVENPHGTANQRKNAVLIGYLGTSGGKFKAGDPLGCVASYWK